MIDIHPGWALSDEDQGNEAMNLERLTFLAHLNLQVPPFAVAGQSKDLPSSRPMGPDTSIGAHSILWDAWDFMDGMPHD
jgi:hypothetical protein